MNILCPQCGFALIVTDRRILGRPARCPTCQFKFVLREPNEAPNGAAARATATDSQVLLEQTVNLSELAVDRGRVYITLDQIRKYHTDAECARFERWIVDRTSIDARYGSGYFIEDYDVWLQLGKPDAPESAR